MNGKSAFISAFYKQRGVAPCFLDLTLKLLLGDN